MDFSSPPPPLVVDQLTQLDVNIDIPPATPSYNASGPDTPYVASVTINDAPESPPPQAFSSAVELGQLQKWAPVHVVDELDEPDKDELDKDDDDMNLDDIDLEKQASKKEVTAKPARKRRTCRQFLKKYCCAGRLIQKEVINRPPPPADMGWFRKTFIWNRPKSVTAILPFCIVTLTWFFVMLQYDLWHLFGENDEGVYGYWLSITMVVGSFIAGATSEGGGSIAFPIMTLVLGLRAAVARDFSLMIQSVGMTSAAFSIFYSQITIEMTAIVYCSIGGLLGICIGLEFIVPGIPDDYSKMIFVSIWLAFAITLFRLNMEKKRKTLDIIENPSMQTKLGLVMVGFVGGNMSALAGSGIDIATFSVLTLWFRLTEKTATPTSVVLMAGNTCIGFFYRAVVQQAIEADTWDFWACAVPVVCVGAPVGAFVSSFFHRQVLACFVYFTDTVQFIAACILTTMSLALGLTTAFVLMVSLGIFSVLMKVGRRRCVNIEHTQQQSLGL